jgi:hypothetical protein
MLQKEILNENELHSYWCPDHFMIVTNILTHSNATDDGKKPSAMTIASLTCTSWNVTKNYLEVMKEGG